MVANLPDNQARVLIYDLETAPNLGYTWAKWDTNVIRFKEDWFILSFAWKWLGNKTTKVVALPDFALYKKEPHNDRDLVKELHRLFDEADVTVTHNGVTFDKPKAQTRMIAHGMHPPSPHKEVDTLKVARKQFAFTSNSLDDLCRSLGLPTKASTGGFDTWLGCLQGDEKAWARMKRYNKRDVVILEELYLRFLPWVPRHPNLAVIADRPGVCKNCLKPGPFHARGWEILAASRRRRFQCQACGSYCTGRQIEKSGAEYIGGST